MKTKFFIIFFYIFTLILSFNIYQPEEVINYINQINLTQADYKIIVSGLSKIFNDTYSYNTMSKNPPQPDFDKNFQNKVDIQKELNEIKIEDKSLYNFYHDLINVTSKLRDGHYFSTFLNLHYILEQFAFISPIKFKINKNNNETRIFGSNNIKDEYKKFFRNNSIFEIIEKNKDIPIKSINGKNPFDFINDFGKNYFEFKNPHGNFPFKFKLLETSFTLDAFPLKLEELTNFKIIYDNDDFFETDYIIDSHLDIKSENISELIKTHMSDFKGDFFPSIIRNTIKRFPEINEILINEINAINTTNKTINWDYNYSEIFKCKADYENEINTYYINLLQGENNQQFINTIIECQKLFDNNTFPVILINDLNLGGMPDVAQTLLETLSSYTSIKMYWSLRKTDIISNLFSVQNLTNADCDISTGGNLFKDGVKIDYENGQSDIFSKAFLMTNKDLRKILDSLKLNLKNKRKPTDIIVFTDGFSFSATSCVIKYLQYYGGGITAGYFGNPNKANIPYDSSLHTTGFYPKSPYDILLFMSPEYQVLFTKYTFYIQMPGFSGYFNPKEMNIPLEYTILPVDEIEPIYEYFNEENYDKFVNISKSIITK